MEDEDIPKAHAAYMVKMCSKRFEDQAAQRGYTFAGLAAQPRRGVPSPAESARIRDLTEVIQELCQGEFAFKPRHVVEATGLTENTVKNRLASNQK